MSGPLVVRDPADAGAPETADIVGLARVGTPTKRLVHRLSAGDIAVIDHEDLDRACAVDLVVRRVGAVLNLATSVTGCYPAGGAQVLHAAGIPLLDIELTDLAARGAISDGARLTLRGQLVLSGNVVVARGLISVLEPRVGRRSGLRGFIANTLEHLRAEQDLFSAPLDLPPVPAPLAARLSGGRALVVTRGPEVRNDLRALQTWIARARPLLVGVDGGGDLLAEAGYSPELIVGDMDSISDAVLCRPVELVVHAYRNGLAPGLRRLTELGRLSSTFRCPGTSADAALLLLDGWGAKTLVTLGSSSSLTDHLDRRRRGMASAMLTRLRLDATVIDATGLSELGELALVPAGRG
jgi:uncharacterized membrane-anchored protein